MTRDASTLLLGIDGGGSKTTALLAGPTGQVLGRGVAGSSNYYAVGAEAAGTALREAARAAFAQAHLAPREPGEPRAVCLGLAGADRPGDHALFTDWARRQWPAAHTIVVNDAELVLAAGTPHGWGVALICGTGSIAVGRAPAGRTARAGGWGYLLGDEGSGYAIGLAALQAVARAHDGRAPATALTHAILAHWRLAAPGDLIARLYQPRVPRTAIADLAALVEAAAAQGDETANRLLQTAGEELAGMVKVVVDRLGFDGPMPCALAGGVLLYGPLTRDSFLQSARRLSLRLDPITPVPEPAQGALVLARQALPAASQVLPAVN